MDERWLISQAREGDKEAFSSLVEIYQSRAVRAAFSLLGNLEDARDSAQEAFVKAYFHLNNFRDESRFYTWFYRILMNVCRDFLRTKKFRVFISFWSDKEEEQAIVDKLASQEKNAGQVLENKELGVKIHDALQKLPFQQKNIFSLRYLDGMSLDEIAEATELTLGAVKANLWQACQKMKTFLKAMDVKEVSDV